MSQPRQFPRFAVEAAVTLTTASGSVAGRTSNLSRGGLCAMVGEPVAVGARVGVEMVLVFDNDSLSEPLAVNGRVVWCTAVENRYQIGLAFVALTAETVRYLDVFLKFLQNGG